jgi:hypothetical protein
VKDKSYSVDGEFFFDREYLIDRLMGKHHIENRKRLIGLEYYEGDPIPITVRRLVQPNVESFIYILNEEALELAGEWAEDWPDLSTEEKIELENLVVDFLERKSPAGFFRVNNIVKKLVTEDDIKEETP